MKIFNTLTRKKEEFIPIDGSKVNFFVCGPTVYDYAHIGHAKTYTQFDFIVKYLRYKGYGVNYLQNITAKYMTLHKMPMSPMGRTLPHTRDI